MLSNSSPPDYRRTKPGRRPKLDGFTGMVNAILEADRNPNVLPKPDGVTDRVGNIPLCQRDGAVLVLYRTALRNYRTFGCDSRIAGDVGA